MNPGPTWGGAFPLESHQPSHFAQLRFGCLWPGIHGDFGEGHGLLCHKLECVWRLGDAFKPSNQLKVVSQTIVVVHVFKIKHKKICETQRLEERLVHVIIIITSSQPWQLCKPTWPWSQDLEPRRGAERVRTWDRSVRSHWESVRLHCLRLWKIQMYTDLSYNIYIMIYVYIMIYIYTPIHYMCTVFTCVYNVFICLHGFVWEQGTQTQMDHGLFMIIYHVPDDNDYIFYGVYRIPDFQTHPYIILHKTIVGCALYTSLFQIMFFGCERKVVIGWSGDLTSSALRPCGPIPGQWGLLRHASFIRSSTKIMWPRGIWNCPTANLGQNQDMCLLHLRKITHAGCYINLDTENFWPFRWLKFQTFQPYPHHIWFIFGPDCYIMVFLSIINHHQ